MTGHDDDGDLLFESLKAGICSSLLGAGVGILKVIWSDNPRVPSANIPFQKVAQSLVLHHGLMLGTAGTAFAFVRRGSKWYRGVDDVWNTVAGCLAGGAMGGIFANNFKRGVGGAAFLAFTVPTMTLLSKYGTGDERNQRKIRPFEASKTETGSLSWE